MIRNLIRGIITLVFGGAGFYVGLILFKLNLFNFLGGQISPIWTYIIMGIVFAVIGFLIAPVSIRGFLVLMRWMDARLTKIPTHDLMGGALGVIIGLIIASLLSDTISQIPFLGPALSILISLSMGYLGLMLGVKRKEEVFGFFNVFPRFRGEKRKNQRG